MADLVSQVREAMSQSGALLAIAHSAEEAAGAESGHAAEAINVAKADYEKAEATAKRGYEKAVAKARETMITAEEEAKSKVAAKQDVADDARAAHLAYEAKETERLGVDIKMPAFSSSGGHTRL